LRNLSNPLRELVAGLARPVLRLLGRDDRGAVGVLIAVLIGGGVLLGMGALTIDVGQLYQNRAELQSGADAGALAVAKTCANGTCDPAQAQPVVTANASSLTGHAAGVDLICGSGTLGGCPGSTGLMTDCPAAPTGATGYVDVHTSTQLGSGSTLLPPVFARLLLGNSSYSGTHVKACAQAEWGPALSASSLAFTISICQWNALTSGGGTPYNTEIALLIKGKAKPCAGPAGQNVAGGFGWLTSDSSCAAAIDLATSTTYTDPGNNVSNACKTAIEQDVANGTTVYVPVFDSISGTGSNAAYHVTGLAAFILNGYQNLPGVHPDVIPAGMAGSCTGNVPCLFGKFTQDLVPLTDEVGSGTSYGATAIKLTG
jgi:Flp pilus assembly protein TadG